MTAPAPLRIGLSARLLHHPPEQLGFRGKTLQYLEQSVAHWLLGHGALAFMVPAIAQGAGLTRSELSVSDYVRALDGMVFQGGADLSPRGYGEEPLYPDWAGDPIRDRYETELLWECLIQRKPVLGICRGAQLLNVALGGSLWQDVASQVPGAIPHVDAAAYDAHAHDLEILPGSGLARLYGMLRQVRVNSIHHQAIRRTGRGLAIEARSSADGIVEAVRWNGSSYALGLQWHPEFHGTGEPGLLDCSPILSEFLAAASERRASAPS